MNIGAMWAGLGGGISNAERERRRANARARVNALRQSAQRQSNRLARQRSAKPPSPPRKAPSPPRKAPSPPRKAPSPPRAPHVMTNKLAKALDEVAEAFVRAGLARNKNVWKRRVLNLRNERARRTRANLQKGHNPLHLPVAGNENYIPVGTKNSNELHKLLRKLNQA